VEPSVVIKPVTSLLTTDALPGAGAAERTGRSRRGKYAQEPADLGAERCVHMRAPVRKSYHIHRKDNISWHTIRVGSYIFTTKRKMLYLDSSA
jgi:hypothetical protein